MRAFGRATAWTRRAACACVSLAASTLAACTLLSDFDGLSGGDDDEDDVAQGTDASARAETSAAADGGREPTDAAGLEGSVDAGPCVVPGLTTRICDVFDRSAAKGDWDTVVFGSGATGTIEIDPDTGSRAYHVVVPELDAGYAQASLDKVVPITSRLFFETDMKYAAFSPVTRQIMSMPFPGTNYVLFFELRSDGLAFVEQITGGGGFERHTFTVVPPANTWFRLTLDVDFATSKVKVLVNGSSVMPPNETFPLIGSYVGTSIRGSIGVRYSPVPSSAADLWFDNAFIATN